MSKTYRLFVGSNNQTKEVERSRLEAILSFYFSGFTIENATGYWKGEKERSAVVTLTDPENKVEQVIHELKAELQQEAIAYQEVNELVFV